MDALLELRPTATGAAAISEECIGEDESLRLTRSFTIFHALMRIFGSGNLPSHLVLHILGADHREGTTPQQTQAMFVDLHQRLGHDEHVQDLDFVFCGPNIPPHLHGTRHTFVHHHAPAAATKDQNICGLDGVWQESPAATPGMMTTRCCDYPPSTAGALTVRLWYNSGLYHDVSGLFATPDALFLFNAGLWGYDDWEPTLEHILGCDRAACPSNHAGNRQASPPPIPATKSGPRNAAPVVVTSYCSEEASDDMETLERALLGEDRSFVELSPGVASSPVGGLEWLWKPEVNPHRSRVPRRTECGVQGRALFENHSWQALRPLRCRHYSKATCNEGLK